MPLFYLEESNKNVGYNIDEAEQLADATTLLQKVGDNMTQESASEGLISTLKGFGKEADEAESIVDKVNQVAKYLAKLIVI